MEIQDFESMKEMAELKALSSLSLEQPLNNEQHRRMINLAMKFNLK